MNDAKEPRRRDDVKDRVTTKGSGPDEEGGASAQGREERHFPVTPWGVRSKGGKAVEPHAVVVEADGREWLVPGHALGDVHMRRESDGSMSVHATASGNWAPGKDAEVRLVGSRTFDEARARHLATLAATNINRCAELKRRQRRAQWHTTRHHAGEGWSLAKRMAVGVAIGAGALWLVGGITPLVAAAGLGYAAVQVVKAGLVVHRWRKQRARIHERFGTRARTTEKAKENGATGREGGWEKKVDYARWTPPAAGVQAGTGAGRAGAGMER